MLGELLGEKRGQANREKGAGNGPADGGGIF